MRKALPLRPYPDRNLTLNTNRYCFSTLRSCSLFSCILFSPESEASCMKNDPDQRMKTYEPPRYCKQNPESFRSHRMQRKQGLSSRLAVTGVIILVSLGVIIHLFLLNGFIFHLHGSILLLFDLGLNFLSLWTLRSLGPLAFGRGRLSRSVGGAGGALGRICNLCLELQPCNPMS